LTLDRLSFWMSPGTAGPEEVARQQIDKCLTEAGWIVQSRAGINLSAGPGIAIREFKLADGFGYADYLLFVDGHAVGAVEAKPQGHSLGGVGWLVQAGGGSYATLLLTRR
jgi:type I site-specific restriction endonuclease